MFFQNSDSEGIEVIQDRTVGKESIGVDFFDAFQNKFLEKTEGEHLQCLKALREDSHMQSMERSVFDFKMFDSDRFKFLFETGRNLKRLWEFIYLSFLDQELLMLGLRYKDNAEDFTRINVTQINICFNAKEHFD